MVLHEVRRDRAMSTKSYYSRYLLAEAVKSMSRQYVVLFTQITYLHSEQSLDFLVKEILL